MDINFYKQLGYQFHRKVGMILCIDRLTAMGLCPRNAVGNFWKCDVGTLLDYCKKNPEYHIVTIIQPGLEINRFEPDGFRYHLADGDANSQLSVEFPPEVIQHFITELNLFVRRVKPQC